ncbi:MAG: hypothetical protein HWD61_12575 [Parachlamydiaceae bacterium]|nr:MAG: hypothetical protein HWD61_12575 [Parachlamydiaceae bacterium]
MELLRDKNLTLGRFDSTVVGDSLDTSCDYPGYDPSFDAVAGLFTAAFNQYVRQDLKVKNDQEYKIIEESASANWNYSKATNQFLNMASKLHDVMIKNKNLKVFVANGYFDLRTPFFATDYTYAHMRLPKNLQDQVNLYYYDSGHMMYLQQASLVKLKQDLANWLTTVLRNLNRPTNPIND